MFLRLSKTKLQALQITAMDQQSTKCPVPDGVSLRKTLHSFIDDLELIVKQFAEILTVPRDERVLGKEANIVSLVELFHVKEAMLNETLKIATEQIERQRMIEKLEQELQKRDEYLIKITTCLRDSEGLMTNAIFQANQKLKAIAQANQRKVSAEELLRYSYLISSSDAIAAPLNWEQGDPQRPFPTDVEMRSGWLSRFTSNDVVPGAPGLMPNSSMPPLMHYSDPFTQHRPFSPTAGGPNMPSAMMPSRMTPANWVAQRALTPPNVSPRAMRLPPPPPFHQATAQQSPHFMGTPSPMVNANIPMHQMHSSPLTQPRISPYGAKVSPQILHQNPMLPQQQQLPMRPATTPQLRQPSPGRAIRPDSFSQQDKMEIRSSDSSSSSSSNSP